MPNRIHLHAGAHKTATTHIQEMLRASQEQLVAAGIALETPNRGRRWTNRFLDYQRSTGWSRRYLGLRIRRAAPRADLWLNSDENFAGAPANLMSRKLLYPDLPARIAQLQRLFSGSELKLFFAIRSYDSFLLSSYAELIRNRGFIPWERFYDPQRFAAYSWLEFFGRVSAVIPPERIVIWRYEDFRLLQGQVLSLLTGMDDVSRIEARYVAKTTRPSLSARAIEQLGAKQDCAPQTPEFRRLLARLSQRYPVGEEFPRLQPWREDERAGFQQRYAQDVDALRERYANMQFLQPTGHPEAAPRRAPINSQPR